MTPNGVTEPAAEGGESPKRPGLRALVMGASGYIGSHLVPRLAAHGYRVRAGSRSLNVLEGRNWPGVERVEVDVLKPPTLEAALRDVDVAYYLVHSMAAGRDFGRLDLAAAGHFAQAAERAGLRRIVYLGGLIPPDADSEHLRSRRQTGERLRAGAVPVTEIRAGIIVGPGSAAFEVIRDLVNHLPLMITPRWVYSKSMPIALDNLLDYLVQVPALAATAGQIYDAAGPELLTYEDLMRQFGRVVGRRPIIIPVPLLTPRLSSYWLRLVTTVPVPIARALVDGLKHDFTAADDRLRTLIPQRLLTYREAVLAALEAERRNAVAARWVEGALMFRNYRPRYAFYAKKASGTALTTAPPEAVWERVSAIGGGNRYYSMNMLWTIREALDWLVGGRGLSHGRRHPNDLRIGDAIDSWRVIGLEPGRRLTLFFGMKAPGSGVLEFAIAPEAGRTRLTMTAYWHPAGFWGLLYWYSLAPFHRLIFKSTTRAIAALAEGRAASAKR